MVKKVETVRAPSLQFVNKKDCACTVSTILSLNYFVYNCISLVINDFNHINASCKIAKVEDDVFRVCLCGNDLLTADVVNLNFVHVLAVHDNISVGRIRIDD